MSLRTIHADCSHGQFVQDSARGSQSPPPAILSSSRIAVKVSLCLLLDLSPDGGAVLFQKTLRP